MAAFAVREARETDVDGIAQLSFTDEPAGDHDVEAFRRCWKWLHGENPCKQGKVLVGVDADERVVGYYAIVPFHFRRDGQPFASGGFVCRLLVAEALRNQLLFPQLELKLLKGYPAWGMDFAYGLINRPLVLKAHLYFKFKEIIALPVLARPVKLQTWSIESCRTNCSGCPCGRWRQSEMRCSPSSAGRAIGESRSSASITFPRNSPSR